MDSGWVPARGKLRQVTPTGDIDPGAIGRTTFSQSKGWLYAVLTDTATGDLRGQGVFLARSGNPAGPWQRIADVDKLFNSGSALGDSNSTYYPGIQADYNQYVLADPSNPEHVYVGLEEVYESTNAGRTWRTVGPYWNVGISCDPEGRTPYDCPPTTHSDQHGDMIYDGQFWTGNDGGAWRRPLSWHERGKWTDLNATLYTTQNYSIAVGKVGDGLAYWGGLQDNGESYTRTGLPEVEQAFTGDGGDTIVDPNNGNRAVEEYTYADMFLTTDGAVNTLREISPSCLSSALLTQPPKECDPNPRFIAPIEMDVKNSTHWVAGGQYVWNDTKGWEPSAAPAPAATGRRSMTPASTTRRLHWQSTVPPRTPHGVVAATRRPSTAGWRRTTAAAGTSFPLPACRTATSPRSRSTRSDAAHVYLTVGSYSRRWIPTAGYGHVFESRDGGATWSDVTGNLPDAPVFKVVLVGHSLVVGTEVGAFIAGTGPASVGRWSRLGTGLPNVTVWDLAVGPDSLVVAGTHGRGDWQVKVTG